MPPTSTIVPAPEGAARACPDDDLSRPARRAGRWARSPAFAGVSGAGRTGPLACVPVRPEPACDRGRGGESPGRVVLGDGDLCVRKSSVTDKDESWVIGSRE